MRSSCSSIVWKKIFQNVKFWNWKLLFNIGTMYHFARKHCSPSFTRNVVATRSGSGECYKGARHMGFHGWYIFLHFSSLTKLVQVVYADEQMLKTSRKSLFFQAKTSTYCLLKACNTFIAWVYWLYIMSSKELNIFYCWLVRLILSYLSKPYTHHLNTTGWKLTAVF